MLIVFDNEGAGRRKEQFEELRERKEDIAPIVDRCLIKTREDRTDSAEELLTELERLVPDLPPSRSVRRSRSSSRSSGAT